MTKEDRRTSANSVWGWNTIITDGSRYMTRVWFGRLRVHVFYRGDADQDPHDHPWDFWTFPLTSYVEEVTVKVDEEKVYKGHGDYDIEEIFATYQQIVPAFRLSYRPATHTHRVIGRWGGAWRLNWKTRNVDFTEALIDPRPIVTVVWRSEFKRKWGFLKHKDGRWCWQAWKDYALHGGKNAPCE